jgi:hypothetical protein
MKRANKNKVEEFIGADCAGERGAINNFYMGGSQIILIVITQNPILTIPGFQFD